MHLGHMQKRLLPLLWLIMPGQALAADLSVTTSASYSAGKYGGTERTK